MKLPGIVEYLGSYWVPAQSIRAETWALGGRHTGRVLEGARSEAKLADVPLQRRMLLAAVIRQARSAPGKRADRPTDGR